MTIVVCHCEEHFEQHILGCGAGMGGHQRGLAYLGFYHSAADRSSNSSQGLALLLSKKRDANEALQRYLDKRIAKGAPLMPNPGDGVLAISGGSIGASPEAENLCVHLEGSSGRTLLATMDGIRDKAFWSLLQLLTSPADSSHHESDKLLDSLKELDRLLRMHSVMGLTPLIRRALLCTWMSPDQVSALLDLWNRRWPEGFQREEESAPRDLATAARACVADLPKFFAGAVHPHADHLVKMATTSAEDAWAAVRALASIAKRKEALGIDNRLVHTAQLGDVLLEAYQMASTEKSAHDPHRKVTQALKLLPDQDRMLAVQSWLVWAQSKLCSAEKVSAFNLASGLFEEDFPGGLFNDLPSRSEFLGEAQSILSRAEAATDIRCAAIEFVAAAGSEDCIVSLLLAPANKEMDQDQIASWIDPQPSFAACSVLHVLRTGRLKISTQLLAKLASRMHECLGPSRPTCDSEKLLEALQRLQHPPGSRVRLANRLRLCVTLPLVFCFSPVRKHREAVHRMLQASFTKAARRMEEPLLEFAIACFIHFLSSAEIFQREVSEPASAFPNSSKICSFLCEALLRSDVQHCMELAWTVLQVCDRTLDFVDREQPASDAVHKAASVLRYIVEKRCPSLAGQVTDGRATKGRMPAELFVARRTSAAQKALPGNDGQGAPEPGAEVGEETAAAETEMALLPAGPVQEGSCTPAEVFQTPKRRASLLKARRPLSPAAPGSGRSVVAAVARPMALTGKSSSLSGASALSSASKKRRTS